MHPCTRAHMSDSFHGWEVRASAQPTNAPAQTQPHYPVPSREVRSTQPPAQTPPRATRHPQHLTDHDPGGHTSNPWNVPGTCLPIPSERSPPEWVGGKKPGIKQMRNTHKTTVRHTRTQGLSQNGHHTSAALRARARARARARLRPIRVRPIRLRPVRVRPVRVRPIFGGQKIFARLKPILT